MRDATLLRGLRGLMPITAIAGGLAALSMSGVPPFFGFIGKELIYKAGVSLGGIEQSLLGVAFVSLLMMALALNAGVGPFFGSLIMKRCRGSPMNAVFDVDRSGCIGLSRSIVWYPSTLGHGNHGRSRDRCDSGNKDQDA